ncbi:hypothetical protein CesoFtcFv8_021451 [Champsocephalus esox]|uniref:Uncharacterized protein n=1 Tax=Champsocephalus esox TaxID=159716 RepID=A0AAN8BDF3_9TELE|nr:hypothetical protein CesoFtcFv8_021451 [Champsocephalus esox]
MEKSTENACPICYRTFTYLGQHLRVSHFVLNKAERGKLVMLANGRLNIRAELCPVPSCTTQKGSRLDRHMKSHSELGPEGINNLDLQFKEAADIEDFGGAESKQPSGANGVNTGPARGSKR